MMTPLASTDNYIPKYISDGKLYFAPLINNLPKSIGAFSYAPKRKKYYAIDTLTKMLLVLDISKGAYQEIALPRAKSTQKPLAVALTKGAILNNIFVAYQNDNAKCRNFCSHAISASLFHCKNNVVNFK